MFFLTQENRSLKHEISKTKIQFDEAQKKQSQENEALKRQVADLLEILNQVDDRVAAQKKEQAPLKRLLEENQRLLKDNTDAKFQVTGMKQDVDAVLDNQNEWQGRNAALKQENGILKQEKMYAEQELSVRERQVKWALELASKSLQPKPPGVSGGVDPVDWRTG